MRRRVSRAGRRTAGTPAFAAAFALLVAFLGVRGVTAQTRPSSAGNASDVPVLRKILVGGASLSAGFGLDPARPTSPDIRLADVVEASVRASHGPRRAR